VAAVAEWEEGSAVICEKLEGWTSLQEELRRRPGAALLKRYGEFARKIHDAGIDQDDFNPTNVLVREHDLKLIDFERLTVVPEVSRARRIQVLAKLVRPQSLGRKLLEPFLEGYARAGEPDLLGEILHMWQEVARTDRAKIRKKCVKENRNFGRLDSPWYTGFYRKDKLTPEQGEALAKRPKGYEYREHPDAIAGWKEANERAVEGGPPPLAVLVERRRRRGLVVYKKNQKPL
jgi:hypothetical protein